MSHPKTQSNLSKDVKKGPELGRKLFAAKNIGQQGRTRYTKNDPIRTQLLVVRSGGDMKGELRVELVMY